MILLESFGVFILEVEVILLFIKVYVFTSVEITGVVWSLPWAFE